jgi:threonine/homoserine/homoserine lactone efflux protein
MFDGVSHALVGLGLGVALAGAPGPVQAVLLAEAVRGGLARGFRAMAGANLTFGVLLVALALGLSVAHLSTNVVRMLKIFGGVFLLWLAVDGFGPATRSIRHRTTGEVSILRLEGLSPWCSTQGCGSF